MSGQGQTPCENCYCPLHQLNQVLEDFAPRTMAEQQRIMAAVEEAGQQSRAAAARKSAGSSTHLIREHGLFGFAGEDTEWGNPFLCFGYHDDSLHIDQLGLWVDLMKCIKPFCDAARAILGWDGRAELQYLPK